MRPKRSWLITYKIANGPLYQYAPPHMISTKWEAVAQALCLAKSLGKEAQVYVNGILI